MSGRIKSLVATLLIHAVFGYVLLVGLGFSIQRHVIDKMTLINLTPDRAPPPPDSPPPEKTAVTPKVTATPPEPLPEAPAAPALQDWASMSPFGRILSVVKWQKYVTDTIKEEDERFAKWRADVPQGSGSGRVARLRPDNLATHTLYWPPTWSNGLLPIIAWGNGYEYDKCTNNSLPYAAFLGELASHGYFIVAIGNDDINYPQPNKTELPDGRQLYVQASALRKGVDWAIAENSRPGSPYQGKLDTGKIAYMGHACGGQMAMTASADPRTTTTVVLNSAAAFSRRGGEGYRAPIAFFDGEQDEGKVHDTGDANSTRAAAAEWPLYRATLAGTGQLAPYSAPDKRWTKAIVAWLDWQLKGDADAAANFPNCGWYCGPPREGWTRFATGL